jgi:hypothetical protein
MFAEVPPDHPLGDLEGPGELADRHAELVIAVGDEVGALALSALASLPFQKGSLLGSEIVLLNRPGDELGMSSK